eukprot:TRINITY_DN87146_c0_g1_i1.p3 TRINITY_DN87146_c0_g1~~TRINITY_DN87146_c0_g1_i1.p3  ORF type:complete len:107 (+),score=23.76 TRINITY_DN87146_c0_g1_i1:66-386(+)
MANTRRVLLPVATLAALAAFVFGFACFVPGSTATDAVSLRGSSTSPPLAAQVAPGLVLLTPLAASAGTAIPEPVLGIGMLSVIVVIVLLVSGIVIGRGLVETIDDL